MRQPLTSSALIALAIVAFATPLHVGAGAQQTPTTISPEALAQIEALIAEKESRSPTQRKIDSQLIYEARQRAGTPWLPACRRSRTTSRTQPTGTRSSTSVRR
jgi:hypothetical protein